MVTRILIDARKLGDTGIGVYIENLVDGLLELAERFSESPFTVTLLVDPAVLDSNDRALSTTCRDAIRRWGERVRFVAEKSAKYSISEMLLLPIRHRTLIRNHDIFHSPHFTLPYRLGIPAVVTVHDVIHLTNPESLLHRVAARPLIASALKRAREVLTVSEASRQELARFFPKLAHSVSVVPNALPRGFEQPRVHDVQSMLKKLSLGSNFALFVGSERPHKGFEPLLDAWAELCREGMELPQLAVVGNRFSERSVRAVSERGLEDSVRFLGQVSARELSMLTHSARLALVPSRIEGFGLVALQALHCGTPCVCTPVPSLREVCGDIAWFSADYSSSAIKAAIEDCLACPEVERAERLRRGQRRAERFDRVRIAGETLAIYQRALGRAELIIPESDKQPVEERAQ